MPTDFENALRNAEGNLSLARDEQTRYEALAKKWRDEVTICQRVLDRMREVVGIPLDAPILRPTSEAPRVGPTPSMRDNASPGREQWLGGLPAEKPTRGASLQAKEVVAAPASASFSEGAASSPQGANGFDRLAVKRLCREWHIAYPVKKSYMAGSAQFKRQALKSTLVAHDDYPAKWLAAGHLPIMSGVGVTFPVMRHCAKVLGVDAHAIEVQAVRLFNDVLIYGTPGVDHVEVGND